MMKKVIALFTVLLTVLLVDIGNVVADIDTGDKLYAIVMINGQVTEETCWESPHNCTIIQGDGWRALIVTELVEILP